MARKRMTRSYRAQVDAATKTMHATWHPIADARTSSDEYDGYAARVVSLLNGGADDIEIADYLGEIERDAMGLAPAGPRDLLEVARKIRAATFAAAEDPAQ